MQLVYIASPFSGDTEFNISRTCGYCRFAIQQGCIPIAPHLHYPQFLDDSDKDELALGLTFALALLAKCDEVWVFGNRISQGMAGEIAEAQRLGVPVRYFNSVYRQEGRRAKRGFAKQNY